MMLDIVSRVENLILNSGQELVSGQAEQVAARIANLFEGEPPGVSARCKWAEGDVKVARAERDAARTRADALAAVIDKVKIELVDKQNTTIALNKRVTELEACCGNVAGTLGAETRRAMDAEAERDAATTRAAMEHARGAGHKAVVDALCGGVPKCDAVMHLRQLAGAAPTARSRLWGDGLYAAADALDALPEATEPELGVKAPEPTDSLKRLGKAIKDAKSTAMKRGSGEYILHGTQWEELVRIHREIEAGRPPTCAKCGQPLPEKGD